MKLAQIHESNVVVAEPSQIYSRLQGAFGRRDRFGRRIHGRRPKQNLIKQLRQKMTQPAAPAPSSQPPVQP